MLSVPCQSVAGIVHSDRKRLLFNLQCSTLLIFLLDCAALPPSTSRGLPSDLPARQRHLWRRTTGHTDDGVVEQPGHRRDVHLIPTPRLTD